MKHFDLAALHNTNGPRGTYVVVSLYIQGGRRTALTHIAVHRSRQEKKAIAFAKALGVKPGPTRLHGMGGRAHGAT